MKARTLTLFLTLGLLGCPVSQPESLLVCDSALPAGLIECFDDAWEERRACWALATGETEFGGYFSAVRDRPFTSRMQKCYEWVDESGVARVYCLNPWDPGYGLAYLRTRWEIWAECVDTFDLQLGECVGVGPRALEDWEPDPFEECLEQQGSVCMRIEDVLWDACRADVNQRARDFYYRTHDSPGTAEIFSAGVEACDDAHFIRQEDCLDEKDFRQENCFIAISDLATCNLEP